MPAVAGGAGCTLHRLGAWVIGMNVLYATTLTVPLLVKRAAFLHDNALVP